MVVATTIVLAPVQVRVLIVVTKERMINGSAALMTERIANHLGKNLRTTHISVNATAILLMPIAKKALPRILAQLLARVMIVRHIAK
ncbi:MAG: hypothetical protein ACYSTF_06990 [Planctomycetota bacterium]